MQRVLQKKEEKTNKSYALVSLVKLGCTLTVNAAGAAVKRVVDEEVTFQAELTVTRWTGEYL